MTGTIIKTNTYFERAIVLVFAVDYKPRRR